MALVQALGNPDIFVTITSNPSWPEVTVALLPGQQAHDRPDIVSQVFYLKLEELLRDIHGRGKDSRGLFGKVVGDVHVIKFQKRGLPHTHILIILNKEDKPQTPADIDQITCAQIPDPECYPELHHTVTTTSTHRSFVPTPGLALQRIRKMKQPSTEQSLRDLQRQCTRL